MVNKEIKLEGIVTTAYHYVTEYYSDITIKTEDNDVYSFRVLCVDHLKDHTALRNGQIVKINAIIDVKTNEILRIKEIWSKIKIREH